jgi:membrane protein implicated in regulation of membrane protease activity
MTLIIMASPMGMLFGYGLAAVVVTVSERWWLTFYYIIAAMIPLTLCLALIPKKYIDIKEHLKLKQQMEDREVQGAMNDHLSDALTNLSSQITTPVQ